MSHHLSEAYKDEEPLHLQDIIPIDFESVQCVPESHEWPPLSDGPGITEKLSIPVIDLRDSNAAQLVGEATQAWGMFQVINHGLPLSLVEEVEVQARRLFSLPKPHKLKVLRSPEGATGYGTARISSFFDKFMWHEGFTIMGSSLDYAKQLWPHDYNRFCQVMDEYQKKMKALAYQLLLLILKALDISEEEVKIWAATASNQDSQGALQLNSYPPCPNPTHALGLPPHTDTLLLTILNQTQTPGLQILRHGLGWITVSPLPGALVVNIGDLLHIYSNAFFPSVYHRVIVNQTSHRISVAYFYGPRMDSPVEPLSKLQCPRYRSLSVNEYISIKAKYLDKALSMIQI